MYFGFVQNLINFLCYGPINDAHGKQKKKKNFRGPYNWLITHMDNLVIRYMLGSGFRVP
jgi:hypothetical protein